LVRSANNKRQHEIIYLFWVKRPFFNTIFCQSPCLW
jgi:hypothetical protein